MMFFYLTSVRDLFSRKIVIWYSLHDEDEPREYPKEVSELDI
mgnify:CR=1 FL=1